MKKPFNQTKFFKVVSSPVVKGLLKSIPFVGEPIENVLDESKNSPAGQVNKQSLIPQLVRLGLYAVLIYLALKGAISWDEADTAKEFMNP